MRLIPKWALVILSTLLAAALIAGCATKQSGTDTKPDPATAWDGTLRIGIASNPTNLDPRVNQDAYGAIAYYNTYEHLVVTKPGTKSELVGELADSYAVSPDGKEWTFKLKNGAKFWDGTPVDSNAVKFTFDSLIKLNKGPASSYRSVKEIQAPDAQTVKFVLGEPFSSFASLLGNIGIINPKVMEKQQNGDFGAAYLATNVMGSGPFRLTEFTPNQQLVLEAVPEYWGPKKPKVKKAIFSVITDTSSLRLQLEKGDLDLAWGIPTDQVIAMFDKPGIKVQEDTGFDFIYVYLNNQKKPFDNVKVRQALAYATDYDSIVKELLKGHGRQLQGPFAFGFEGYKAPSFYYKRDLAKAKQLLADAGYPSGFSLTLLHASATVGGAQAAQVLQANWAEIGVKVQLQELAEATRRERVDKADFEASMGQWIASAALPYWTMNIWHESARFGLAGDRSFYKNPAVDELLAKANAEPDAAKRAELYLRAQDQIMQDAPYVYLYQRNAMMPMRDSIKGFLFSPLTYRTNLVDLSK